MPMKADKETETDGQSTIRVHGCGGQILQLKDPKIFVPFGRVKLILMSYGMQDNSPKKETSHLRTPSQSREGKGGMSG